MKAGQQEKPGADVDAIYRSICDMIAGGLAPGARLPTERQIAQQHSAGRGTVRRIMNRLAREGIVTRHVGRGTFVSETARTQMDATASPTSFGLLEIIEARLLFEPVMMELVALRASEDDLDHFDNLIASMKSAPTWSEYRQSKANLHLAFAKATKNPVLLAMFELIGLVRRDLGLDHPANSYLPETALREAGTADSVALVQALRARDLDKARELRRERLLRAIAALAGA